MLQVSAEFEERWIMPHCVGATDGKHVNIEWPANSGTLDHNYKGSFSKSHLAVCDAHTERVFITITSAYDVTFYFILITCNSFLRSRRFCAGSCTWKLATAAVRVTAQGLHALHEDSRETHKRRVFKYRLSRARRVIENAFGILAQRWRTLRRPFKAKTDNINRFVAACIVLHSFLMKESSASSAAYCPPGSADSEDWEGRLSPGSWREEEAAGGALLPSKSTW
ncbi:hypothetical protein HPB49_004171 [Dermacentor silvarum]|uniref:Uncharacterized protein n=1 Tax=Dermacentor silvarum TaxID=543639 RepID=A0ACB8CPX2_DERSI|nr:hypothetical protein HPB49_004171 [Dermacentor silvarum]